MNRDVSYAAHMTYFLEMIEFIDFFLKGLERFFIEKTSKPEVFFYFVVLVNKKTYYSITFFAGTI